MKHFLALLGLSLLVYGCEPVSNPQNGGNNNPNNNPNTNNPNSGKNGNNSNQSNGKTAELSYKGKKLILTKHAKCRMGCRFIDEAEIMEVIAQNNINERKSTTEKQGDKCPTTAYEGVSRDEQELRIVVAYCDGDEVAKVVTVIDTGNEFSCTCD